MKLSVQGLNSFYGPAHILFDVALEVGNGEVVALLGRNGAGKSTTFRSIVGLVEQREGQIVFEGRDVSAEPTHAIVRSGLGYVPEERRIFTDLTVEENLEVGRQPPRPNAPQWTRDKLFALFPNLGEMRNRPGGRMSGGEQQMLTIARTLMGNPSLVLLDEPSEGLSPKIVEQMVEAFHAAPPPSTIEGGAEAVPVVDRGDSAALAEPSAPALPEAASTDAPAAAPVEAAPSPAEERAPAEPSPADVAEPPRHVASADVPTHEVTGPVSNPKRGWWRRVTGS